MASVSAVVGSGNIAGAATAIAAGGPGALLWMLAAALVGMATKFADTFVVCLVSGLTIVLSGLWDSGAEGVALAMRAFSLLLPGNWGQYIVLCASILFGYSCLITYYNYMEKGWINLVGSTKGKFILKMYMDSVYHHRFVQFTWFCMGSCRYMQRPYNHTEPYCPCNYG